MILDFDVLISLISDLGQNHLELVLKNTNLFNELYCHPLLYFTINNILQYTCITIFSVVSPVSISFGLGEFLSSLTSMFGESW